MFTQKGEAAHWKKCFFVLVFTLPIVLNLPVVSFICYFKHFFPPSSLNHCVPAIQVKGPILQKKSLYQYFLRKTCTTEFLVSSGDTRKKIHLLLLPSLFGKCVCFQELSSALCDVTKGSGTSSFWDCSPTQVLVPCLWKCGRFMSKVFFFGCCWRLQTEC